MKVLLVGESWSILTTNTMGFDHVTIGRYNEAGGPLIDALSGMGVTVDYMPSHKAQLYFPENLAELQAYQAVIFSDVGSNSLLLHPKVQFECARMTNRLDLVRHYVQEGGGFLMCGGYMSYSGFEGKARYAMTPISDVLPVHILNYDDRVEKPEGVFPEIKNPAHPVLNGLETLEWPFFLGYNKLSTNPKAELIAAFGEDVFMAGWNYGKGRAFSFASDCVPHWGPPGFIGWPGYPLLFNNIVKWLAKLI
jgi:uncharacterized membrane protein